MISGRFGEYGELFFEMELIASNGEIFPVEVLLDTGFTTGYLAINFQDIEALEWPLIRSKIRLGTARGEDFFDLYEGRVIIDSQEFIIPVHVGDGRCSALAKPVVRLASCSLGVLRNSRWISLHSANIDYKAHS